MADRSEIHGDTPSVDLTVRGHLWFLKRYTATTICGWPQHRSFVSVYRLTRESVLLSFSEIIASDFDHFSSLFDPFKPFTRF